ncbi:hypothetical protein GC174_07370 [bacterium]|nr:hypothetical protein [bacterium]
MPPDGANDINSIDLDDLQILSRIEGPENFESFLGRLKSSRQKVLVRKFKESPETTVREIAEIGGLLKELNHSAIHQALGLSDDKAGRQYIVMEFLSCTTLTELIESTGKLSNKEDIYNILQVTEEVLRFAHEKGIYHTEFNSDHILFFEEDGQIKIKLTGFESTLLNRFIEPESAQNQSAAALEVFKLVLILAYTITGKLYSPDQIEPYDTILSHLASTQGKLRLLAETLRRYLLKGRSSELSFDSFFHEIELWYHQTGSKREAPISQECKRTEEEILISNLKESVHDIVTLKRTQMSNEETAVMKIAEIASMEGPRLSPSKSIGRIVSSSIASVLILCSLIFFFLSFQNDLRENFHSKRTIGPTSKLEEDKRSKQTQRKFAGHIPATTSPQAISPPKERESIVENVSRPLKPGDKFYAEEMPSDKLLIKRSYHPPPNKKHSTFTNNL